MSEYTIDTSVLIDLQQRYPRDVFPSAWESLEQLIDDERACACGEVIEETRRGKDDLHAWATAYPGFACPVTDAEIAEAARISTQFPEWVRAEKNAADPFLVAHARITGRVVVTDERAAGPNVAPHNIKVPNVAATVGVETMSFLDVARAEGWKF